MAREPVTDEQAREAYYVLDRQYREAVASYGEDAKKMAEDGEFDHGDEARERFMEYVEQSVDGSGWIIYYANARHVLLVSENRDAMQDELGEVSGRDGDVNWCGMAYFAMRADIFEWLEHNGIDVNDPCPEPEEEEGAEEEEEVPA